MSQLRKLHNEIDRTMKKVDEMLDDFDSLNERVSGSFSPFFFLFFSLFFLFLPSFLGSLLRHFLPVMLLYF